MHGSESNSYRSEAAGGLRAGDTGRRVRLAGWVHRRRDHGQLIFIDLRDRSGRVQLVFDAEVSPEAHGLAGTLRMEFVITVEGEVVGRTPENINSSLPTGAVEVMVSSVSLS